MGKLGKRAAAAKATEMFGVLISPSTAHRASKKPGQPPVKPGPATIIPYEVEHRLEFLCLALREMNLPVFRFMVMNYVNVLIEGTVFAEKLAHREVRKCWYYNWLGRCKRLTTANLRPLEVTRAQWATPDNVKRHYDMLVEKFLEIGVAVRVTGYDPEKPYAEELKITKPSRIFSMDESRLTNDTTEKSKAKQNRSIVGKGRNGASDSREVLVNKAAPDASTCCQQIVPMANAVAQTIITFMQELQQDNDSMLQLFLHSVELCFASQRAYGVTAIHDIAHGDVPIATAVAFLSIITFMKQLPQANSSMLQLFPRSVALCFASQRAYDVTVVSSDTRRMAPNLATNARHIQLVFFGFTSFGRPKSTTLHNIYSFQGRTCGSEQWPQQPPSYRGTRDPPVLPLGASGVATPVPEQWCKGVFGPPR